MAVSGLALWAYGCALLLCFAGTANCTVHIYSVAYDDGSGGTLFSGDLDDNSVIVCTLSGVPWPGAQTTLQMDCGSSGYSASLDFGPADENGYISETVNVARPGFSGNFGAAECDMYNCGCGLPNCISWEGSSW